ncbi:exodeoxyribonuclease I [Zhongshania aliphaticivorans]|uniref:exodeoxyribonuclease I n=1 Tax=Zhongshania aliphaticivorans TaxID=1470434 RepID=UPI0012E5B309|nr:exodeoxyribonuclease I [Zhongshania aliphaticivorans]CAA0115028.1 Exodeoxyribonuclease I [Zhongshania aliphaticivorans]
MANQTFYWHDYETWGANPARDRPVQFAGVRTDAELNIIGEPLMVYSRPSPDYLPHPEACLITGITPQQALQEGVSESEFIATVHAELSQPGTCGVGYNSIRFDDEVTRYTLYRNFYDPYAREWQNGNSRWDLIDVARLCRALRPEGIEWPLREDGTPSFRLEELSAANGLSHESAHDALSDVYATIDLAKLLKQRQPKLFDYALSLRDKRTVAAMLDVVKQVPVLHVSGRLPAAKFCSALMMPLALHPENKNSVIVCDLSVDPTPLIELSAEEIAARVFSATADLPEGTERIPLKEIHINRAPIIATAKLVDESVSQRLQIDMAQCRRHWAQLHKAPGVIEKLQKIFGSRQFAESTDPDVMLYGGGFFSGDDKKMMDEVRRATPDILAMHSYHFSDARLPELLWRYRARNFPMSLSDSEREKWRSFCRRCLREPEQGQLGFAEFRQRLVELAGERSSSKDVMILSELNDYADALEQEGL